MLQVHSGQPTVLDDENTVHLFDQQKTDQLHELLHKERRIRGSHVRIIPRQTRCNSSGFESMRMCRVCSVVQCE